MATSRAFSAMLNEYLAIDLLKEEMRKRDWLLQNVEIDEGWKGGTLPVPFQGQHASTFQFGSLAASNNISQYNYVRGQLTSQKEAWGSIQFLHRDLMEHDGKINEKSFLKILPGQIEDFVDCMKMNMSVNLLNGSHFAALTVDGTAGGVAEVDRIDRFTLSQECVIDDGDSAPLTVYVIAIDTNGGTLLKGAVTFSATRGGAAVDISAYTVAQAAKVFHVGAQADSYTSVKSQLLPLAAGGTAAIFGQTKLDYPYLQSVAVSGAAVSATNIVSKIFDAYGQRQIRGKGGKLPKVVLSFKHMGSILAILELGIGSGVGAKGPYSVVPGSRTVSAYGWQTVSIGSVTGDILEIVAIQEMDDDWIWFCDMDSVTFYTNNFLVRRKAPDGKEYFESRDTTGYSYILDHCCFGDIVVKSPWKHAVLHSIPNY